MKQFDYVIVGGGAAACVLANRLSQDTKLRVCLIELGGWLANAQTTNDVPVYARGAARDYDLWEQNGCNGWGYDSVLRYFKKSQHRQAGRDNFHEQGGELNIAPTTHSSLIGDCFLEAAHNLGFPYNKDFNGLIQEGIGRYELMQKDGVPWSAKRAFLDAARYRKNLTIIKRARVEQIVIEKIKNRRAATGIKLLSAWGKRKTIVANKEVILSAGTLGSPQLLLLSGIGGEAKLRPHSIKHLYELPGVGENLQDHPEYILSFRSHMLDGVGFSAAMLMRDIVNSFKRWMNRCTEMIPNEAECGGFLYVDYAQASPDIQLHIMRGLVGGHGQIQPWGQGFSCRVRVLRPECRGRVFLRSEKVSDSPNVDFAFMSDLSDISKLLAGTKLAQKFLCNAAFNAIKGEGFYASDSRDDAELTQDIKDRAGTVGHAVGTCKMGMDPMAVVDPQLCVYGVDRLRVVDASVMPSLVSGDTEVATIMIAEKAADMILKRL